MFIIYCSCSNHFPGASDGKVSACNAAYPGFIPGSGASSGEGDGYPLQYSCLENSMDRGAWQATVHWGCKESDKTDRLTLSLHFFFFKASALHIVYIIFFFSRKPYVVILL